MEHLRLPAPAPGSTCPRALLPPCPTAAYLQRQLQLPLRHVHIAPADQRGGAAGICLATVVGIPPRRLQLPLQQVQGGEVDRRPRTLLAVAALKLLQQRHSCGILLAPQVLIGPRQLHLAGQGAAGRRSQLLPAPVKAAGPAALVQQRGNEAGGGQDEAICLCLLGLQLSLQGILLQLPGRITRRRHLFQAALLAQAVVGIRRHLQAA